MNERHNLSQQSVLLVSDFANANVEAHYATKEDLENKEFKEKNTMNCFPYLDLDDGKQRIFTSHAINNYLAHQSGNKDLYGATPFQEAQIDQWISLSSQVYNFAKTIGEQVFGEKPHNETRFNMAVRVVQDSARGVENGLKGKDFLLGKSLSLADITVFNAFVQPFQTVLDEAFRSEVPALAAWFTKMAANTHVIKRLGHIKPCAFAVSFNSEGLPVWEAKKAAPAAPAKKAEDDDDMDLFGDDDGEAAAAAAAAKEKAQKAKKPKKEVIEKSIILFEVKPWGEETDLDDLAKKILAISMDGLMWKT